MLRVIKHVVKSVMAIASTTATGIVAGLGYIFVTSAECVRNLGGAIEVDPSKLNITAIENEYLNNETISVPFNVALNQGIFDQCSEVLEDAAIAGLVIGTAYVVLDSTHKYFKAREREQQRLRGINADDEGSSHSPLINDRRKKTLCC